MGELIRRFLKDRSGVTAIEYALIAGIVSIAIVSGATLIGGKVNGTLQNAGNSLKTE
jgi:pilus assembly protein Flp/PilA